MINFRKMQSGPVLTPKPAINILLADDDKDDRLFFEEVLEELPLPAQITSVNDGQHLMQLLNKKIGKLPDVLFLDLNMPRKNGFECLQEIKSNNRLKHIPVIILSTSIDENIANQLYENGAYLYICKPPDFQKLKKAIGHALTLVLKNSIPTTEEKMIFTEKRKAVATVNEP